MFESILGNIISKYFGDFIEGIDKNSLNVGIWKGKIILQNVGLKADIIKKLSLPLNIHYSSIGKLSIDIPWNALGSKPVTILLEDMLVMVTLMKKDEWKNIDIDSVWKKIGNLQGFVNEAVQKYNLQKKEAQDKINTNGARGIVGKMTQRILDNMQIKIKNVHFRFENHITDIPFAMGFHLNQILIYTANQKWEEEFIDRTNPKFKTESLRKMISLSKLKIYWDSSNAKLENLINQQKTQEIMKKSLEDRIETIIEITGNCKLLQNNKLNKATILDPELDISAILEPVQIRFLKNQLEQIVRTLEHFNNFQRYKLKYQKAIKNKFESLTQQEKDKYQFNFKFLFEKVQLSEYRSNFNSELILNQIFVNHTIDLQTFLESIATTPENILNDIAKDIVINLIKNGKIKEAETKQLGKLQYLTKFFSSKDITQNIDPNEIQKMEAMLENSFDDSSSQLPNFNSDSEDLSYVRKLRFNLEIKSGKFYIAKISPTNIEEGLVLFHDNLNLHIEQFPIGNLVDVKLKNYGINLETKSNNSNAISIPFLQRLNHRKTLKDNEYMISINIQNNPKGKESGMHVDIDLLAFEVIYQAIIIERFLRFITIKSDDEYLKSSTHAAINNVKNKTTSEMTNAITKEVKKFIRISIGAPNIIIPFSPDSGFSKECWVADFGDLEIKSIHNQDYSINTVQEEIYEEYVISLTNIQFQHFPSHKAYDQSKEDIENKSKEENLVTGKSMIYNIVDNFDLKVTIQKKSAVNSKNEMANNYPDLNIDIVMSNFNFKMKPYIYQNLMRITEHLIYTIPDSVEQNELQKNKLIPGNTKMGILYYKEYNWKTPGGLWTKYYVIFKGPYLYFFQKQSDQSAKFSFFIKYSELYLVPDPDKKYCFTIENQYNNGVFGCDDEHQMNEWLNIIFHKIIEFGSLELTQNSDSANSSIKQKTVETKPNYSITKAKLKFRADTIFINIDIDDNCSKLLQTEINNLNFEFIQKTSLVDISFNLFSIEIIDYVYQYTSPNLIPLFTSKLTKGMLKAQESFRDKTKITPSVVNINIHLIKPDHPEYAQDNTDMNVEINFGFLFFNLKPDSITTIQKFFALHDRTPNKNLINLATLKTMNNDNKVSIDKRSSIGFSNDNQRLSLGDKSSPTRRNSVLSSSPDISNGRKSTGPSLENLHEEKRIIMNLKMNVKKTVIRFIHRESHVCLTKIPMKNIKFNMIRKVYHSEIRISMKKLEIVEMTNYPNTINSDIDWKKVKRNNILNNVSDDDHNFLEIDIDIYDPKSGLGDPRRNTFHFIAIRLGKIKLMFFNQPILRLFDFINYQIYPLLYGETPKLEENQAISTIRDAYFFDIQVFVSESVLLLKSAPNAKEYIEISVDDVNINNDIHRKPDRLLLLGTTDTIISEEFNISLNNMFIWKIKNGKRYEMSRSIQMNISLDRILYLNAYSYIYGKSNINAAYFIRVHSTPIILTMYRNDYLLWLKVLYSNIYYDDLLDPIFYVNYTKRNLKPAPLDVILKINQITLLAFKDGDPFEIPMFSLNFRKFKIKMDRNEDYESVMNITAKEFDCSFFEVDNDKNMLFERKMLGKLTEIKTYPLTSSESHILDEILNYYNTICANLKKSHKEENDFVVFKTYTIAQRSMQVCLNNPRIYLQTVTYYKLMKFIAIDPAVYPSTPVPNFPNYKRVLEVPVTYGQLIDLKNMIVTIPSGNRKENFDTNVIGVAGNFAIAATYYQVLTLEDLKIMNNRKKYDRPFDQTNPQNIYYQLNFSGQDLEFFTAHLNDLMATNDLSQIKRRNIIIPFNMIFTRKFHTILSKDETKILNAICNDINIEKMIISMSYKDYLLLYNTIQFQKEQLAIIKAPEKMESEEIVMSDMPPEINNKNALLKPIGLKRQTTYVYKPVSLGNKTNDLEDKLDEKIEEKEEEEDNNEEFNTESQEIDNQICTLDTPKHLDDNKEKVITIQTNDIEDFEEEDWMEQFNTKSHGIEMALMDDYSESLAPVLEFCLHELDVHLIKLKMKIRINGGAIFASSYYNGFICSWEPFIEKYGLNFNIISQTKNPNLGLKLVTMPGYEDLNFNVSEKMIETLVNVTNLWKKDFEEKRVDQPIVIAGIEVKTHYEENIYVTPFMICNLIGCDIEIRPGNTNNQSKAQHSNKHGPDLQKVISIPNNNVGYYLVHNEADEILEQTKLDICHESHKIQLTICHPNLKCEPVNDINLNKLGLKEYKIKNEKSVFKIFCELKIDTTNRILIIHSEMTLTNSTNYILRVMLEHESLENFTLDIDPKCSKGIPFEYTNGKISLRILDLHSDFSEKKILKDFYQLARSTDANKTPNKDQLWKYIFKCGNNNYLMGNCVRKDPESDLVNLIFEAPFEIKNCCALPIVFALNARHLKSKPQPKTLNTQESQQEISFCPVNFTTLRVKSRHFDWSNEVSISIITRKSSEDNDVRVQESEIYGTLELKDVLGLKLLIYIHEKISNCGGKVIYLYTKGCLINETPWSLYYYNVDKNKKSTLVPGQTRIPSREDDTNGLNNSNSNIILLNEMYSLAGSLNIHSKDMSKEVELGKIGGSYLEVLEKNGRGKIVSIKEMCINSSVQQCGNIIFDNVIQQFDSPNS